MEVVAAWCCDHQGETSVVTAHVKRQQMGKSGYSLHRLLFKLTPKGVVFSFLFLFF